MPEHGYSQFQRYLKKSFGGARVPRGSFDDCIQDAWREMLDRLGRGSLDDAMTRAAERGLGATLAADPDLARTVYRVIDAVAKRAKRFQPIDVAAEPASPSFQLDDRMDRLRRAMPHLGAFEAEVIRGTLAGYQPIELAAQLGLAPKTISNAKSAAIRKLAAVA